MSKKNKKPMNPRVKENLLLGAKSIINNDACVELGRSRPWYSAIIAGLLAAIITVIPTLVNNMRTQGSDCLKTPTYGFETGLIHFQKDVKESSLSLHFDVVNELLSVNTETWAEFLDSPSSSASVEEPWYHHYNDVTGFLDFQVFVTGKDGADFTNFANLVFEGKNPYKTDAKIEFYAGLEEAPVNTPTNASALVFGLSEFRLYKFNALGAWVFGNQTTTWQYKSQLPLNELIPNAPEGLDIDELDAYRNDTIAQWSTFLNDAYRYQRDINAWRTTGIFLGIYAAFIMFMGVMIFLMTRGKNNPYRIITFWESQKIVYWAAPTPAILSMIFGFFINGGIMQFLFIFLFGMRIMWLSMKSLRPQA